MAAFKHAILLYVGHLSLEFFCFSHPPIFCFKQLGFKTYVCFWAFWLRSSVVFKCALQFFLYLFTLFVAVWIRVYIFNLPQFILFIELLQVKYIVDLQQYIFIHKSIVSSRQKEQYAQRHENNGEHPVIGELKYVVQNGLSKPGREMEGKRGWEVIRGVIYKGLVNCDKLFALYPEGNGKPLKWFMLRSDMNRFTFGED